MRKPFIMLVTLFCTTINYISLAQEPWKILEKYECLSVTVYDTRDDTYLDDENNTAIVTYSQINGTQKTSELITLVIGSYTNYADILSKESYEDEEYEYIRYHCRSFDNKSESADIIIAFIYEKNKNKIVPYCIICSFTFSTKEFVLGKIVRHV